MNKFFIENSENRTIFYNICQLSTKKGIDILIRAYSAAFASTPNDVLLVLKTYVNMQNRSRDLEIIKKYIGDVRAKTRIPVKDWPPILPLVQTMTDEEICSLHRRGDAYVCSSRAEGYCLPAFDALAHGNTVISHQAGGLSEFVTQDNSLVYGGSQSLFYDMPHSDPGLYTGLEQCFEPSVAELALIMKHFHLLRKGNEEHVLNEKNKEEWNAVLQRRENGKLLADKMDYRKVSDQIVKQLVTAYDTWKENGVVRYEND